MKKILLLLLIISSLCSCQHKESTKELSTTFDWITGHWERVNEETGKQTLEHWIRINDNEYHGFGFTLQNSDTIWQEKIRLIRRDSIWNLEVTGQGEVQPTIFRLINIEKEGFDSENPENEFPKVISYSREGDQLNAVISGGGMEIPFEFRPVNRKQ